MNVEIKISTPEDADIIAVMLEELLNEIIEITGIQHFNFDLKVTGDRCKQFIEKGKYTVYQAVDIKTNTTIGFITLCESSSLYAEGTFGIIQELYINRKYRSQGIGAMLVNTAKLHSKVRKWKRLELCTPPLPEFERTVDFYKRQNFEVTGGKKMRVLL